MTKADRKTLILDKAHCLLMQNDGDFSLDELIQEANIAKGTLYKEFANKDELLLELLLRHEHNVSVVFAGSFGQKDSAPVVITRFLLFFLLQPKQTMIYYQLEERLSAVVGLRFKQLYPLRFYNLTQLHRATFSYLHTQNTALDTRRYIQTLYTLVLGECALYASSFYRFYYPNATRNQTLLSVLYHALNLPKLYPATPKPKNRPVDEFSPFGKLSPPSL